MKPALDDTRRQLGELGAMAAQVEQAERDILARAEKRLDEVENEISDARKNAASDAEAADRYQQLVLERGKLHQVIAQAHQHLN